MVVAFGSHMSILLFFLFIRRLLPENDNSEKFLFCGYEWTDAASSYTAVGRKAVLQRIF